MSGIWRIMTYDALIWSNHIYDRFTCIDALWQSWIPIFQQPLGYPPSHQLRVKNGGVLFRLGSQGICPKSETCPTNRSIYIYIDIGLRSSLSSDCKSVRWQYCCSSALFSNTSLLRPYSTSGRPSSFLPSFLPPFLPSFITHSLTYLPTMQIVANVKPTASVAEKKGLSGLYVFK